MEEFLIFYAPFLLVIASIGVAFWAVKDDRAVRQKNNQ